MHGLPKKKVQYFKLETGGGGRRDGGLTLGTGTGAAPTLGTGNAVLRSLAGSHCKPDMLA